MQINFEIPSIMSIPFCFYVIMFFETIPTILDKYTDDEFLKLFQFV